ncbi:MAG: NAD(P)-dependent oxidoreductase [Clostridia bacterium]|nr:NAD(P)-dependent oxidoreductase [Clostridia bacterium]
MRLIVGSGFLGSALLKYTAANTDAPLLATVRDQAHMLPVSGVTWISCDITRHGDLQRLATACGGAPLTVFYFAACHNIDYIFEHPADAYRINIDALRDFLHTVPNIQTLFFASTDCVYGEQTADCPQFREETPLHPVNIYGRQKAEAEAIIRAYGFTAVRLPFMLGPSPFPDKPHFYDTIREKLENGEPIEMIDGMRRSVLSYRQAAALLFSLSLLPRDRIPDVINLGGDQSYSKYEMGCALAKKFHAPTSLVKKITETQGEKFFKDQRASSAVMDNTLLKRLLGLRELRWEEDIC